MNYAVFITVVARVVSSLVTCLTLLSIVSSTFQAATIDNQVMQRMTTSYNGIVQRGNLTLLYGINGAITYSSDGCLSFSRVNVGDDRNIIYMETSSNGFVGISQTSVVMSEDGRSWTSYKIDSIVDAVVYKNVLYVLGSSRIQTYKCVNGLPQIGQVFIDTLFNPTNIAVSDNDIYVGFDKTSIAIIDRQSGAISTKRVVTDLNAFMSDISWSYGRLDVVTRKDIMNGIYTSSIIRSSDRGLHWNLITPFGSGLINPCFLIEESETYEAALSTFNGVRYRDFVHMVFARMDSTHYWKDTLAHDIVNKSDSIPTRFVLGTKIGRYSFQQIKRINDSTIVAVGPDNSIVVSSDGGQTWSFKSIMRLASGSREEMQVIDSSHVYFYEGPIVYSTSDGGVTFLPPKYTYCPQLITSVVEAFHNDSIGTCILKVAPLDTFSANILISRDYWDSFEINKRDSLYYFTDTARQRGQYHSIRHEAMRFADGYAQVVYAADTRSNIVTQKSYLAMLDSNLILVDLLPCLDSVAVIACAKVSDGNIYALCLYESGLNQADSLGNSATYRYRYSIVRWLASTNSLEVVSPDIHVPTELAVRNGKYYFSPSVYRASWSLGTDMYFRTFRNTIYRFDCAHSGLDSLHMPCMYFNGDGDNFSAYGTSVACVGYNQLLYICDDVISQHWDSVSIQSNLSAWDSYNFLEKPFSTDQVLGINKASESRSYIQAAIRGKAPGEAYLSLVRVDAKPQINPVPDILLDRVYLYCSPPSPQPASDVVQTNVYWDSGISVDEIRVDLYSIFGERIKESGITTTSTSDHSLRVVCSCLGLPRGAFILKVTLRQTAYFTPFVVN